MAIQSLLIIVAVLAVLLVAGVPISYSIGISSLIAILQTVPLDVSVITGAQRIFVGMSSGAAMLAATEVAKKLDSGKIVVIFPDRGEKYLSTKLFRCGEL